VGRIYELMEKAKRQGLTDAEREELHRHFLRIALQDLAILEDQGLVEANERDEPKD